MITITGEAKEIAELVEALKSRESARNTGFIIPTGGDNCQHGAIHFAPSSHNHCSSAGSINQCTT